MFAIFFCFVCACACWLFWCPSSVVSSFFFFFFFSTNTFTLVCLSQLRFHRVCHFLFRSCMCACAIIIRLVVLLRPFPFSNYVRHFDLCISTCVSMPVSTPVSTPLPTPVSTPVPTPGIYVTFFVTFLNVLLCVVWVAL